MQANVARERRVTGTVCANGKTVLTARCKKGVSANNTRIKMHRSLALSQMYVKVSPGGQGM